MICASVNRDCFSVRLLARTDSPKNWRKLRGSGHRETLPDPGKGIAPLGGNRKRTAFPPPPARRWLTDWLHNRNRGQRPTRRARSARRGRGGRWPGALAPGGPGVSVALWQGRWPLPGCARRALAEGFPAFREGSPCGRHFFSTLLSKCRVSVRKDRTGTHSILNPFARFGNGRPGGTRTPTQGVMSALL